MAVLSTKLHVPAARHRLIERPRLTGRLTGQLGRDSTPPRLVLVSAPAGFGKTTFLSQWLKSRRAGWAAWLSLDSGDNDPRRYLTALATAVHAAAPAVGEDALRLLETSTQLPTEAVLTSLVNDLANDLDASSGGGAIVLDDYHLIEDPAVHEATTFLLEHLPGQATLAISSRADPPLPLPRLRSRGELAEFRALDLRFTPSEASSFLARVMELDLSDSDVTALEERTEGWAAGLQLAGLSMRGRSNPSAFIAEFAGSHRFVVDYLLEEVLRRQPEELTRFLLDTVVLTQMSAPLCDAVTGRTDGQQMLETLERHNMFLVPLDDHRRWYRYHHLFADALRVRVLTGDPAHTDQLHRRASEWLAAHGQPEEAIEHALAAGDTTQAADLVELAIPENRRGRGDRLLRLWVQRLPTALVRQRPVLTTFAAWTRFIEGDLDGTDALLDAAERALAALPNDELRQATEAGNLELARLPGTIEVYRAALAQARGDTDATARHAQRALETAGPEDHLARSGGAGFLAFSYWAQGHLAQALATFDQTVESLHAAGFLADELGSSVPRATMWLTRGRPDIARRLYEEALDLANRQPAALSSAGDLHVGLADTLREAGELDDAEDHLRTARELGDGASLPENRYRWYLAMARLEQARGNLDEAVSLVEQAQPLHVSGFYPDVQPIPAVLARLRIAQARLDDARAWARAHHLSSEEPHSALGYLQEYDYLTLARLLIAEHRQSRDPGPLTPVHGLLDRWLVAAQEGGRGGSVIEIHLLASLADHAEGRTDAALERLLVALEAGVPVGYRRLFLDEGQPILDLLTQAEGGSGWSGASDLVRALRRSPTGIPSTAAREASPGREPLSERELEVLRLLATPALTGPDIARQLYMSVNTFRTHTRHIFTKLDVNSRAAAVQRATDQGLI